MTILGGGWPGPGPCCPLCRSGPGRPILATPCPADPTPPLPTGSCTWPRAGLGEACTALPALVLSPHPSPASFRNAVYSTPRDFASPVSGTTWTPSLRKSGKTWRKGKLHRRGLPASLALGRECGQVPGWQRHLSWSPWAARPLHPRQGWGCTGAVMAASSRGGQEQRLQRAGAQPAVGRGPGGGQRRPSGGQASRVQEPPRCRDHRAGTDEGLDTGTEGSRGWAGWAFRPPPRTWTSRPPLQVIPWLLCTRGQAWRALCGFIRSRNCLQ